MTCNIPAKNVGFSLYFEIIRGFGSKMKKRFIFAISDFPNLQYARKLQSFLPRCIKELSGKSLRYNIVLAIFT